MLESIISELTTDLARIEKERQEELAELVVLGTALVAAGAIREPTLKWDPEAGHWLEWDMAGEDPIRLEHSSERGWVYCGPLAYVDATSSEAVRWLQEDAPEFFSGLEGCGRACIRRWRSRMKEANRE